MTTRLLRILVLAAALGWAGSALAVTVSIDTSAARAVLKAIGNPDLSLPEAAQIATMPGNQGVIRKLREFRIDATPAGFAHALYAAAHDQTVTAPEETAFQFDLLKPKVKQLDELVASIDAEPHAFQASIQDRIAMYTPPGADVKLSGYVVAAGDGGGYAFGGTDFYLNLIMTDELVLARSVTTHEMYHAVQGAFAKERQAPADRAEGDTSPETACMASARLLANLYEEGTAVEVADVSLLAKAQSPTGLRIRADMADGIKHMNTSAYLLEMSFASLAATRPVPYDEVYNVGFFGHSILYNVAYAMAKAIDDVDGPKGLAAFAKRPAYAFVRRYTQLSAYGKDSMHPLIGPNTAAALDLVAGGCR